MAYPPSFSITELPRSCARCRVFLLITATLVDKSFHFDNMGKLFPIFS